MDNSERIVKMQVNSKGIGAEIKGAKRGTLRLTVPRQKKRPLLKSNGLKYQSKLASI
jgi:hypothetical protein